MVQTNHQWIVDRTGIEQRHIATPDIATSDMAVEAANAALAQRGIPASDLDAILVCTVTPDMMFPATACLVQNRIGATHAWGFDLIAACAGFLYGLNTASQLVASGTHKKIMVIGADTMSRIIDYTDRSTCILFGDGAGAFLIERAEDDEDAGFIDFIGEIDGSGGQYLKMPAGGSRMPATADTVSNHLHYVKQDGQQVFKYAVKKISELCETLLQRNNFTADDVAILIPHQANRRIMVATAERLNIPLERVLININEYGNTTAGTIPLATRDAIRQNRLKKGDLVLYAAVGAGYTAGACLYRWAF
jgi:3-oxoacyl-[acyl-carrier-protein] synthase-3